MPEARIPKESEQSQGNPGGCQARVSFTIWRSIESLASISEGSVFARLNVTHSSHGGRFLSLASNDKVKCFQITLCQFPFMGKGLGSRSEVDGFRVEFRHRQLIKGLPEDRPSIRSR